MFFVGNRLDLGAELWMTDPVSGRTDLTQDIRAGVNGSDPQYLIALKDTLLFSANDWSHGGELWAADANGPRLVVDATPGFWGTGARSLTAGKELAFFFRPGVGIDGSYSYLWVTDGTAIGTHLVTDTVVTQYWQQLVVVDDVAYFVGYAPYSGDELWRSDGTARGTRMVKDIAPGAPRSLPRDLVVVGNLVYFTADDGAGTGRELWRSDGSGSGTWRVRDIRPGPESSLNWGLTTSCDRLFFVADDGVAGRELWVSDGTDEGTSMVADLEPGPGGIQLYHPVAHQCGVAFVLDLPTYRPGAVVLRRHRVGNCVGQGHQSRARRCRDLRPRQMGEKLYFGANDGGSGIELWSSDTTTAGTTMVLDIVAGPEGSGPGELATIGDEIWFAASTGAAGRELWRSDGSPSGTRMVYDAGFPFCQTRDPAWEVVAASSAVHRRWRRAESCGCPTAPRPERGSLGISTPDLWARIPIPSRCSVIAWRSAPMTVPVTAYGFRTARRRAPSHSQAPRRA